MKSPPYEEINLPFAKIEIYPKYLISTIHEGALIDYLELKQLFVIFDEKYPGKNFGYISNRINDYTINPTCYLKAKEMPNLVCMAVICNNESTYNTALFEQKFHKRIAKIFYSGEESINWVESMLNEEKKKADL